VVEVPALEPACDCAAVALWSGGVVLEFGVDGVVAPAVALVWPDGVALLCALTPAWALLAGGFDVLLAELGLLLGAEVPAATPA
jgi:hypothetical protein